MRFRKGSKIEVLCKKEVPSGAWRSAEIICGNGQKYVVRYEGSNELDRVSRELIRPCPPLDSAEDVAPGDLVEVFDNFYWKMANVSKVLGGFYFLVRLLGSSLEFPVSKSDIRLRRSWQNDKWMVIGKDSGSCDGMKSDELKHRSNDGSHIRRKKLRISVNLRTRQIQLKDGEDVQKSPTSSPGSLKRRRNSQDDAYAGARQKYKADEKNGRLDCVKAAYFSAVPKKLRSTALPRKMVGEKRVRASAEKRKTGYSEMDKVGRKQTGGFGGFFAQNCKSNDAAGVASSVGSCSIKGNCFSDAGARLSSRPVGDINDYCSDAESSTKVDFGAVIHRLELNAYHSTIVALHASGPLSWEQEAMMSNLRLYLNISDDEHLKEIRNLVSSDNRIPVR